ncbi:MAG: hypothetical protein RSB59_00670 [Clostridia bacterium]
MLIEFPNIVKGLRKAIGDYSKTAVGKKVLADRTPSVNDSYTNDIAKCPCVTVEEKVNVALAKGREIDNSETLSRLMYEVNLYDNLTNKVEVCYKLANVVNDYFMGLQIQNMRFVRITCEPIANTANANIYRIIMRFENKNI